MSPTAKPRDIAHQHRAILNRVIDGDTVVLDVIVDVNLVHLADHLRILDVDTPEVTEILGPAATDFTRAWVRDHTDLIVRTWRRDSFGRRLGYLQDRHTGEDLSVALATVGLIVAAHLKEMQP